MSCQWMNQTRFQDSMIIVRSSPSLWTARKSHWVSTKTVDGSEIPLTLEKMVDLSFLQNFVSNFQQTSPKYKYARIFQTINSCLFESGVWFRGMLEQSWIVSRSLVCFNGFLNQKSIGRQEFGTWYGAQQSRKTTTKSPPASGLSTYI